MSEQAKWHPGDRAELKVDITDKLVRDFSEWSGDKNPLHVDAEYAQATRFHRRVAHGMSFGSLFSRLIGMNIPGPGALWYCSSGQWHNYYNDWSYQNTGAALCVGDKVTYSDPKYADMDCTITGVNNLN